jgi:hypothetical protein
MKITWDDDGEAERLAEIRKRARKQLKLVRSKLPRLSKGQVTIVLRMTVSAYHAGWRDCVQEVRASEDEEAAYTHAQRKYVSRRGVEARRKKSAQMAIRAEFQAAQKAGKPVTAKQLVKKHGASPATVYRALRGLVKPPKR